MIVCVHVTHEAVVQSGGIGSVLRGLITSRAYAQRVDRTLLLGPVDPGRQDVPLGPEGEVLYDNLQGIRLASASPALDTVAMLYGVRLVYGRRRLWTESAEAWPEVLLVDVSHPHAKVDEFKYFLSEHFGLDSRRWENFPEYERYLRLGDPGYAAVQTLLGDGSFRCWLIAHEFMGVCTVLKSMLVGDPRFRTAFYAHEVATARLLVEDGPGRDLTFYNVLRHARRHGGYLSDYFGPRDDYHKHALVSQAWRCDAVLAVGDWVVEELRFLGPEFAQRDISLVYNGIPAAQVDREMRHQARARLAGYVAELLGAKPHWIFTHVTRLVRSKGLWRDLRVLEHLDARLVRRRQRAVLLVLATEAGARPAEEVWRMADEYGWPVVHREGFPDLTPGELEFDLQVRSFNARARAVRVVFINQFGFDRESCGPAMPAGMSFHDLRRGTDAEFGQSLYEPFGIAMLEPIAAGAISVLSDVCGSVGFVRRSLAGRDFSALVVGDYTALPGPMDVDAMRALGPDDCRRVEAVASASVAVQLDERLPARQGERRRRLIEGADLAERMSWERVVEDMLAKALDLG